MRPCRRKTQWKQSDNQLPQEQCHRRPGMNLTLKLIRSGDFAAVTVVGTGLVVNKLTSSECNLVIGAIHFHKGLDENW